MLTVETLSCFAEKTAWSYMQLFCHNTLALQTDRQTTDRQHPMTKAELRNAKMGHLSWTCTSTETCTVPTLISKIVNKCAQKQRIVSALIKSKNRYLKMPVSTEIRNSGHTALALQFHFRFPVAICREMIQWKWKRCRVGRISFDVCVSKPICLCKLCTFATLWPVIVWYIAVIVPL